MALQGLAEMTLGVPKVNETLAFYREFGLSESSPGVFATADGGDQLRVVQRPYRQLVEYVLSAEDADDVARVKANAEQADLAVTSNDDGSISVREPVVGIGARVAVRQAVRPKPYESPIMNSPGNSARPGERAPAIFDQGPARPRNLGHVLYATPDLDASMRFLQKVLGFELSDVSPGVIAFLRCSEDHHNVGLIGSPVPFFHHSSWQVNDVDEIGKGAQNLLAVDPGRSVWGLGRHFLGSNLFWYFRDPSGNFAEYYADLDQIPVAAEWEARQWEPDKALYAWGPPVPKDFVAPSDVEEIAAAIRGGRVKIARFTEAGRTRLGVVDGDGIIDAGDAMPNDLGTVIAAGGLASFEANGARFPLEAVRLEAPIAQPPEFLAIGLNYADHVAESGMKKPEMPIVFNKQVSCVTGPYDPIEVPTVAPTLVDYEGELGVVIGSRCRNVAVADAHEVVAGYLVVNDVSVRDWQRASPTMTMGKSWDTHGPTGPWLVTADEVGDPHDLRIRTWVDDDLRQDATTTQMITNVWELISFLSTAFTLLPGTIIATGTPSGVGFVMDPPRCLDPGMHVRIEIERIGAIDNPVVAQSVR